MENDRAARIVTEWVREHYAPLYRFAYRLSGSASDAEDLTQQAFLAAQKNLDQLRDPHRAKAWLCAILRNCYRKSVRRKNGVNVISLEEIGEPTSGRQSDLRLERQDIQAVLEELPDEFRIPLILFYFQEFSYKEIAEQLELPIGTVMSRLARGKVWLRRRLVSGQSSSAEHQTDPRGVRFASS